MTFITNSGGTLMLGSTPFVVVGCNMIGLGQLEGNGQDPAMYPTHYQIDDMLGTAVEMGATTVRAHTLGISTGHFLSVWPTINGQTQLAAFNSIDYAIFRAGQLGLHLIIPLGDNWRYYHGGKKNFTDYRGLTNASSTLAQEAVFYTDSNCIADFKAYINVILTRVNQFSGIAYKDDPTILCWETGNEWQQPAPDYTWTENIAAYIKSVDSNHLVMDGTGLAVNMTAVTSNAHVDIYTNHFYPPKNSTVTSEANAVAANGKVYIVGEFGWTDYQPGNMTMTQDTSFSHSGSKSLKCVVGSVASSDFYDQVQQRSIALTATHNYTLTFWMQALAPYTFRAAIQATTGFTVYAQANFTPTVGTWTQYTLHLTNAPVDPTAMINFNYGLAATTTWIDDVSLVDDANPGTNLILNPGFEASSLTSWSAVVKTIDSLTSFLSLVEGNTNIHGDLFWVLFPHLEKRGYHFHTGDNYNMFYPGITTDMQTRAQQLRTHAYTLRGLSVPASLITAGPNIYSIQQTDTLDIITWSGVIGGNTYSIESSPTQNGTYTEIASGLVDMQGSFNNSAIAASQWYRVRAYNLDGVAGAYGPSVQAFARTSKVHTDGRTGGQGDGVPR